MRPSILPFPGYRVDGVDFPSGRGRWIDYAQDDFNASQATPEWHSWLHGIRKDPPNVDPIVNASRPPWLAVSS